MSAKSKEFWENALAYGLDHPFGVWAPSLCFIMAIVSRVLVWDLPGAGLVFVTLIGYLAIWLVAGIIAALIELASDHRNDVLDARLLQEAFRSASHWKFKFEETLDFYESTDGENLDVMQQLADQSNIVFDRHARWRNGREQLDAASMTCEFEALTSRLETANSEMNDSMRARMTKARLMRHSA